MIYDICYSILGICLCEIMVQILDFEMTSVRWIDFMGDLFVLWVTDVLKIFFN